MPSDTFLMTGASEPFRLAGACPSSGGPHYGPLGERSFLVADAATADGTARVRIALWRCRECGVLLCGTGPADAPLSGPGHGANVQEFTWLEQAEQSAPAAMASPRPASARAFRRGNGGPARKEQVR